MRQPSPYLLPILLLAVIAILTDHPTVTMVAIWIVLVLLCLLLRRPISRPLAAACRRLPPLRRVAWGLTGLVAIGTTAGLFLAPPPWRATDTPNGSAKPAMITESRGFFGTERDDRGNRYTWTQERASVTFNFRARYPIRVTFRVRSAAIAGGPDAPVHVAMNGVDVGQIRADPRDSAFQSITLRVVPNSSQRGETEIQLTSTPFAPGKGDARTLGTMVQSITVDRSNAGPVLSGRLWIIWALPALAIVATLVTLGAWRDRWGMAGYAAVPVCALGAEVSAVLVVLAMRTGHFALAPYLAWTTGAAAIGMCFALAALILPFGPQGAPSLLHYARVTLTRDFPALSAGAARLRALMAARVAVPPPTRREIARDLGMIFLIALGVRLVWALLVPPWLAPDEPSHYTYTSHIVEQAQVPHPPYPDEPRYAPEVDRSVALTHVSEIDSFWTQELPPSTHLPIVAAYGAARTYAGPHADRLTSGGASTTRYPPLYYLLDAIPYAIARHGPILSRLYAARSLSAILGALGCVFAYLLAWEVRRQRRWGWTLALCMALLPMYVFDTATVNNDAAMTCFATLLIWLAVRARMRPSLSLRLAFAVGIASALVLLTKPTALSVVVVAGIVMLPRIAPRAGTAWQRLRPALAPGSVYAMGVAALYGPWLAFRLYYFHAIVLGTIPVAPFFRVPMGISPVGAAGPGDAGATPPPALAETGSIWSFLRYEAGKGPEYFHWLLIKTFWGYFGWLNVPLADRVYVPIVVFYLIGLIGFAVQFALQPERRAILWLLCGFVLAQAFFLFDLVDYGVYRATGSDASLGLQGRYFFPILAPLLLLLLSGWDHLCRERPLTLRLAPVAMLCLHLIALATLLSRYYGVTFG